jgi:succinate-acetate transporter protein
MTQDDTQRRVEDATRVVLRPMASPLPLAFFAFGVGSLMLSAAQLGVIPKQESRDLALVLGAFAFPPMLLAAVLAFFARETLGATALERVMNLGKNRIEMRIPQSACFPRDLCFPHS